VEKFDAAIALGLWIAIFLWGANNAGTGQTNWQRLLTNATLPPE